MTADNRVVIISDFDGVLVDSFDTLYRANAEALRSTAVPLEERAYRSLFTGNVHKKLRELVGKERFDAFSFAKKKLLDERYPNVPLFPFAPQLIRGLRAISNLVIVSSCQEDLIKRVLQTHGLLQNFDRVFGDNQETKLVKLKAAARLFGDTAATAFFISDTYGDIIEGKEAGLRTIAVTWGFHDRELLRQAEPEFLAEDYNAVIEFCAKNAHAI